MPQLTVGIKEHVDYWTHCSYARFAVGINVRVMFTLASSNVWSHMAGARRHVSVELYQ